MILIYALPRTGTRTIDAAFRNCWIRSIHHIAPKTTMRWFTFIDMIGKSTDVARKLYMEDTPFNTEADTEPHLFFIARELSKVFPNAINIHIKRDPKKWLSSMMNWDPAYAFKMWEMTFEYPGLDWEFPKYFDEMEPFESMCWFYKYMNEYIADKVDIKETFILEDMKYPDLFAAVGKSKNYNDKIEYLRVGTKDSWRTEKWLPENWDEEYKDIYREYFHAEV